MKGNILLNGYDKVKWGTSLEDIKKSYDGLEDITTNEEKDSDIICMQQLFLEGSFILSLIK